VGLRLHRIWILLAVVEEGFRIPRFQLLCEPACEAPGIAGVDGHAARRHDQPALLRQRRQGLTDPIGMNGAAVVLDREGHDRHIRRGEEVAERHPGAVVEPAPGVGCHL
jgi:hypothetical protein